MASEVSQTTFNKLYEGNLIPLYTCLTGLVWVVHDYFLTIEDEVKYVWPHRMGFGKFLFLWIRYYGILLPLFDVVQIHAFAIPGITNDNLCVAMDSIIRVVGALSLWAIEIVMQMRIYALYRCSRRVALINFGLFLISIAGFLWVLAHNAERRRAVIAEAIHLPLPGCPSIHSGIEWAQWIPATAYEGILFFWVVYKTLESAMQRWNNVTYESLYSIIVRDNILYFFGITCLLVFNNLMVVGVTKIPWFGYSPFHAAMEIMTSRMLLNLYKAHNQGKNASMSNTLTSPMQFVAPLAVGPVDEEYELDKSII